MSEFVGQSVDINRYQINVVRLLGEGGYGYVYLAENSNTSAPANAQRFALKRCFCGDSEGKAVIETEISTMQKLTESNSRYSVKLFDYAKRKRSGSSMVEYLVLMEFCPG